ncbi:hypothetical protein M2282_004302 [Variovorax boronicumulans]|uniref:hypothetical protein n=1 Tax=Variovorax boronicumulans TaxID=436515 RepID=UPI0024768503|nr:hypothetical protein [Variovorax boronicumulans]MDH6169138.1 hypothetical protein [Variovorax boronicumulans]
MPDDSFSPTPMHPAPLGTGCLQFALDWQMDAVRRMFLVQRQQWEMLTSWQRATGAVQREFTDLWIRRLGGGMPLDG